MEKAIILIFLGIFLILMTGCLNSGNGGGENQNAVGTTEIVPPNANQDNQVFQNRQMGNRTGWNRTGNFRGSRTNITGMRNRFNLTGMSDDQLTKLKARLNLSADASEEEVMDALQKMREGRGIRPPNSPFGNPANNP